MAVNTGPWLEKNNLLNQLIQEMKNPVISAGGLLSKFFSGQVSSLTETDLHYLGLVRDDLNKLEKLIIQFLEVLGSESIKCEPGHPVTGSGNDRINIMGFRIDGNGVGPINRKILVKNDGKIVQPRAENMLPGEQPKRKYNFTGFIGDSPPMIKLYDKLEKIADTDSTILITGESGTGKELVAKFIHCNSSRSRGPFVPLNCAAIPKDLLESELFGHEKGAFTGAFNTRIGRFELAHKGTLFLDEIGELDPALQVKLLRVLQEREFERVGGIKAIKVDVRILSATNKDLERAVRDGKFREDLYYRLNVIPISIPPLRKRVEDIPLLVDFFARELAKKKGRKPLKFSPDAMECFMKYRWTGNVRELENLIERLTILINEDIITASDLPEKFHPVLDSKATDSFQTGETINMDIPEYGIDISSVVESMERNLILKALKKTGGVKNRAAKLLGLNRTTLIEKMKKMRIELQKTVISPPNY